MNRLVMVLLLASPLAFAGPESETAAAMTMETPLAACKSLVESAVKKDFTAVQKLSLGHGHGMRKGKAGFEKMHKDAWTKLESLNCTTETVANDRAFVEAESGTGKRLIPFVKTDMGWKFDGRTYMSFYGKPGKRGVAGSM